MGPLNGYLLFSGTGSGSSIVDFASVEVEILNELDIEVLNPLVEVEFDCGGVQQAINFLRDSEGNIILDANGHPIVVGR